MPGKIVMQGTLGGGRRGRPSCGKTMKVSSTLELIIGLEQWFSTRGDFVP